MMRVVTWMLGLVLVFMIVGPVMAQTAPAADPAGGMDLAMRQKIIAHVQDFIVMMQNNAVWTPQGLVILQGNRLLHYGTDMRLAHTVTLPLPPAPAVAPPTTTPPPPATPGVVAPPLPTLRSIVPAKILPTTDGLLIVRDQQIIRLDRNFRVLGQTAIPDLPPLTPAELNLICPMCQHLMMMGGGMTPSAGGCVCPPGGCMVPAPLVPLLTPPR